MTPHEEFLARTVLLDNGCRIPVSVRTPGKPMALSWDGYIQIASGGVKGRAHRVAWILANGSVPDGMTLDHLCRNRQCCELSHLEPVTNRENVKRGNLPTVAKEHLTKLNKKRRKCLECDMESTPAGMTLHHKASGHSGWMPKETERVQ